MPRTRNQRRNRTNNDENIQSLEPQNALEVETLTALPVATTASSTSAVSVQTDREVGQWVPFPQDPVAQEGSSVQSGVSSNMVLRRSAGDVLKLARDIIPSFDGTNMAVNMFVEHCRAAATSVDDTDMHLLLMMIKNKVTGQARLHIQDKVGATFEEILKSLQRAFADRADTSQLAQELAVIKRNTSESIADYGIRVSRILNKIIIRVMDKNPGTHGLERCQEYKENAIKSFMRGLDRETLYFVKERSPTTLDDAIELAAEAGSENMTWNSVHGVPSADNKNDAKNGTSRKRCATIQGTDGSPQVKKGKSLSTIKCFHCNEFGHYKRTCPNLKKDKVNSKRDSYKVCSYCELENHVVDQCRLKQRHDRERQNKRNRSGALKRI